MEVKHSALRLSIPTISGGSATFAPRTIVGVAGLKSLYRFVAAQNSASPVTRNGFPRFDDSLGRVRIEPESYAC